MLNCQLMVAWVALRSRTSAWTSLPRASSPGSRCCLKRRLADEETLQREVQALVRERNATRVGINWRFKTQDARTKLHRLYPFDSKVD